MRPIFENKPSRSDEEIARSLVSAVLQVSNRQEYHKDTWSVYRIGKSRYISDAKVSPILPRKYLN